MILNKLNYLRNLSEAPFDFPMFDFPKLDSPNLETYGDILADPTIGTVEFRNYRISTPLYILHS